ncbi:MAG: triose-phosphate isomerase, partial [Sedimenticola sp.]|nr:triose-phosphate isomerase [Sedimenticola sp.]
MRRPLVAGNWKMNGSLESIKLLLEGVKAGMSDVKQAEVAVCAPAIYLPAVQQQLQGSAVAWGSQDVSAEASGAYTGEIATSMLKEFGCKYAIVGHSERRAYHGESDETVAKKYAAARAAGLIPILCVGETLEEREQGVTEAVVARQLDALINLEGVAALADGVVAYEPVWA